MTFSRLIRVISRAVSLSEPPIPSATPTPSPSTSILTAAVSWIFVDVASFLIVMVVCGVVVWRLRHNARQALLDHPQRVLTKEYLDKQKEVNGESIYSFELILV
ncbi:uncharacterized protein N7483_012636 [Penicillium malachiteum]|uniref:uncharacterized protein n=1 Tax=Penicillium malachiteum TaxID=1324776 RepID=UPI0025480824|nr:uncharacterized protein N7483_012636 [Penicillium malachiteum]KAJ5715455.1 hypothetical protein N7483_012636 [Penicillium malachiteum]